MFRRSQRVGLLVTAAVLAVSMVGSGLLPATAVWADPNASGSCAESGGTTSQVNGITVCTPAQTIAQGFTPDQEAQSYSYYVTLGDCIENHMGNNGGGNFPTKISENGNAPTSEWFDSTDVYGYVYPDGAKTSCADIASAALTLWGWTGSTETFLTAMGYSYQANASSGFPQYAGTSDGPTRLKNFQTAVQQQVYGGTAPSLSTAANYDIALNAFTQNGGACDATDLGTYDSLNASIQKYVDAGTVAQAAHGRSYTRTIYAKLPIVDPTTGVATDHGYSYTYSSEASANGNTSDLVTLYGYPGSLKTSSCEDLVKSIQANASAYRAWVKTHTTKDTLTLDDCKEHPTDPSCTTATATSCNIDQVGWLLCPVLTTAAHLADSAYGFLADNFLATNPSLLNTNPTATTTDDSGATVPVGTGTYTAWKIMLTIADAAFIIAFLIIIFSQLTSIGVSNYGVKKLLPRLIIVAILVNVSFWICSIAVDVSNILGYSLKDLLTTVANQVAKSGGGTAVDTTDQSGNLGGILATIITAGALVWVNLGAVVIAIVGALITLLIIFVLLAARQALIVLLVVIAPLAFVAYLLPNTEGWFKKWRTMFTSLLLLFPIIGVLYGACLLASEILKQVAGTNVILQIMAYVALVIPLIAVVPLLKGSLNGVGKIGTSIQSFGSKTRGGAQKKAQKTYDNSRLGKFRAYRTDRWNQRRDAIQGGTYQGRGGNANPLNWLTAANRGANRASGRFGGTLAGRGAAIASKEDVEMLGNAGSRLNGMSFDDQPLSPDQLMQIALARDVTDRAGNVVAKKSSFDEYARRAAIERVTKIATVPQANALVDASSYMSLAERRTLASSLPGSNAAAKAIYLGGKTLGDIEQGTATSYRAVLQAIQGGKITAEALANGDKDSVAKIMDVAMSTPIDSDERVALKAAYDELNKPDSKLRERIVAGGAHDRALQGIKSL